MRVQLSILFLLLSAIRLAAQLSPGDLSNAHRDLEGISKCTQCHDLGSKVSNDKCLSCHKELKARVDQNSGFHASREVKGKDCAKCHSDHHGRNFDMVRFDENSFDHLLTGFELTGRHKSGWSSKGKKIDCRSCHNADLVAEPELKKKKETFLGLNKDCSACHKDVHQRTLGNNCAKCHTTEEFIPASKFNHDKSDFPLHGKHKTVGCAECHAKETRNGELFQKFSDIAFSNCSSCHKDAHNNNLGPNCKECHNETAFDDFTNLNKFNHGKTLFPLKGKHKQVNCRECHQMAGITPLTVFQDRKGVLTDQCATCHKDVHEGKFGTNCAECHNENSFQKVESMGAFDHNRTGFALRGSHVQVDCKKCHISEKMTDPLPHQHCADCHKDYHEGQFASYGISPDCIVCHQVDGFAETTYSLEDHAKTKFPLEGAHVATPCFACHKKEEKWNFRKIGQRCIDCHQDVHAGQIDAKWYPGNTCEQCHSSAEWRDNHFDHTRTAFALKGQHAKLQCRECHVPETGFKYGRFAGLHSACSDCHEDPHAAQFVLDGVTDCSRCHGFEVWTIKKFDHDKTAFKLEGKHRDAACKECHKPVIPKDNQLVVQYKFKSFECVVCHK